jgi:hypothetical protein
MSMTPREAACLFVGRGGMAQSVDEMLSQTTTPNELARAQDVMILRGV